VSTCGNRFQSFSIDTRILVRQHSSTTMPITCSDCIDWPHVWPSVCLPGVCKVQLKELLSKAAPDIPLNCR
jgi:hypothetical protein